MNENAAYAQNMELHTETEFCHSSNAHWRIWVDMNESRDASHCGNLVLVSPDRLDKVFQANASINQQPQPGAADNAAKQDRGQPQALQTGWGELKKRTSKVICQLKYLKSNH